MTDRTALAHRLMLEDKRAFYLLMAIEAFFVLPEKHYPARGADVFSVRVVAIGAGHFAFGYGVMVLKHELAFDIQVAVKTGLGAGADNPAFIDWIFKMQTCRPVAGFACLGLARLGVLVVYVNRDAGVVAKLEILVLFLVAVGAGLPADIRSAGNRRGSHNHRAGFENTA